MEGHAKQCVEGCCALLKKKIEHKNKVSTHCLNQSQFLKEEFGDSGRMINSVSHTLLKCLSLARIGRPDLFMLSTIFGKSNHEMKKSL